MSLVHDDSHIRTFVELLGLSDETIYYSIQTRTKYGAKQNIAFFRNYCLGKNLENRIDRYSGLEYEYSDTSQEIDPSHMVCFVKYNPCDVNKANSKVIKKMCAQKDNALDYRMNLQTKREKGSITDEDYFERLKNTPVVQNADKLFLNALQGSEKNRNVLDVDVDDKTLIKALLKRFPNPLLVIETHGGFHVLYRVTWVDNKELIEYCQRVQTNQNNKNIICVNRGGLCPVPGTIQGGFHVKLRYDLMVGQK